MVVFLGWTLLSVCLLVCASQGKLWSLPILKHLGLISKTGFTTFFIFLKKNSFYYLRCRIRIKCNLNLEDKSYENQVKKVSNIEGEFGMWIFNP